MEIQTDKKLLAESEARAEASYLLDQLELNPAASCATPPGYDDACAFIERRYKACYGASIECVYPNLVLVCNAQNDCLAAVGYRSHTATFFLEQYLDDDIEAALSQAYGSNVQRAGVVEIGNLVGTQSHAVYSLMQYLWRHLMSLHYEYVALTCTEAMLRRFKRLPYRHLAYADKQKVEKAVLWGSYYCCNPEVIAGKLSHYDQRFSRFIKPEELYLTVLSASTETQHRKVS